ncbi:MAG: hypothetical protein ABIA12_00055 [Candidatus Aenigmatarchaeota archaeon]
MDAVFAALGALDVFAAYLLFNPFSEAAVLYLMLYVLAKGGFFLLTSVASRNLNPFFLALCAVDVLTGIALGAISLGYASAPAVAPFVSFVRVAAVLKGLYGLAASALG